MKLKCKKTYSCTSTVWVLQLKHIPLWRMNWHWYIQYTGLTLFSLAVGRTRITALFSYSLQVLFIGDTAETASALHSRMLFRPLPWRGFMVTDDSVICIDHFCEWELFLPQIQLPTRTVRLLSVTRAVLQLITVSHAVTSFTLDIPCALGCIVSITIYGLITFPWKFWARSTTCQPTQLSTATVTTGTYYCS